MTENRTSALLGLLLVFLLCGGLYYFYRVGGTDGGDAPPARPGEAAGPEVVESVTGTVDSTTGEPGSEAEEGGEEEDWVARMRTALVTPSDFSVSVRVLDPQGEETEAEVGILVVRPADYLMGMIERHADGDYRAYLPESGDYAVRAVRDGTAIRRAFSVDESAPAAAVEVRFAGVSSVSGRFFSSRGGLEESVRAPFKVLGEAELRVEMVDESDPENTALSAVIEESGRYSVSGLAEGTYLLVVRNLFFVERIEVGPNDRIVRDIVLPSGRIHGRVTDAATGKPVEDVQVVIQLRADAKGTLNLLEKAGFPRVSDRLAPDASGAYSFANLPPGEYSLFSNGSWYSVVGGTATLTPETDDVRLDFALTQGSGVGISITDTEGNELPDGIWRIHGIISGFRGNVGGLNAGEHDFLATAPGHAAELRPKVRFLPGEFTPLAFRLPVSADTVLTFMDQYGSPVPGVRVSTPVGGVNLQLVLKSIYRYPELMTESGPDGRVLIRGFAAGACRIVARKDGFEKVDREVTVASGGAVTVQLAAGDHTFPRHLRIASVSPGSTADRLGLRPGDILLRYGDTDLQSRRDLLAAIQAASGADEGSVVIRVRSGATESDLTASTGPLGIRVETVEGD